MELLIWSLVDRFFYPDPRDLIFAALLVVGSLLFMLAVFRALIKATISGFTFLTFIVALLEFRYILDNLWHAGQEKPFFMRWGPALLVASGATFFAFHLISNLVRNRKYVLMAAIVSLGMMLSLVFILPPQDSFEKKFKLPDIVLIVMDTARTDHLSVYGYARPTTPGLEWFAKKAAIYENAMSPASWTPPGHASLFTGLLPSGHGTDGDFQVFNPPGLTLAEALQRAGYKTVAMVNNPQLASHFGWNRGFQSYKAMWTAPRLSFSWILWKIRSWHEDWPWLGSTKRTLFSARRWWAGTHEKPRFLFLNLIDPHSPYGKSHQFKNSFLDESSKKAPDISNDSEDYDSGLIRAEGAALRRVIARYDGDIRFMDSCLESFFRWLEKRDELDNSLIILTSDHGERLGERGLLGHQLGLDNVLLHVPLIVRYPSKISPGRVSKSVQTHGIYSTILSVLGIRDEDDSIKRMPPLDKQLLSMTVAQMRNQGNYLQSLRKRNPAFNPSLFNRDWSSVFDGEWKLLKSNQGEICLYNIKNDPVEEKNIRGDFAEQVAKLLPYAGALPEFGHGKRPKEVPKDIIKLLKSLGYVYK